MRGSGERWWATVYFASLNGREEAEKCGKVWSGQAYRNSGEKILKATATTVHKLIQGSKVFLIPTFQRRYTWRKEQWEQLWDDLISESDVAHPNDPDVLYGHFLGSVVLHPAPGPASTLMRHQVIDGQQRVTTILVLLAALRDVRKSVDPNWNSASIDDQYLRNPFSSDYPSRLVPTKLDREAYDQTVRKSTPTGDIGMAYNFFRSRIEKVHTNATVDLQHLEDTLLLHMLIVEINTKTGDSVSSIFNTLNSKGLDLSPADLVRNELLHHLGEEQAEAAHSQYWIPMEEAFVNTKAKSPDREFVTFLWSREVAINPKTSRDNLFSTFERRLRDRLADADSERRQQLTLDFLKEMHRDHLLFRIVRDPARASSDPDISAEMRDALQTLKEWRSEPATPIALWTLKQAKNGLADQADAASAIWTLINYLVRRTLQGIPTNQLNRLLTPVAHDLDERPSSRSLAEQMRVLLSKAGYYWPTNEQVRSAALTNPLYASARRYVPFLLSRVEELLPGKELAQLKKLQIEHVIPQTLSDEWISHFSAADASVEEAETLMHTLGNLTLTDNNQGMGNELFEHKRDKYYKDSALRLNRHLAELDDFAPADVKERTAYLIELLLKTFHEEPLNVTSSPSEMSGASAEDRLKSLLQSLPVNTWVAEEDLVSVLGVTAAEVRSLVTGLPATDSRLIRDDSGDIPEWLGEDMRVQVAQQDSAQGQPETRISVVSLNKLAQDSTDEEDSSNDSEAS